MALAGVVAAILAAGAIAAAIAYDRLAWKSPQDLENSVRACKPTKATMEPIGFWIARGYFDAEPWQIAIFGDSQLGGLRAADARTAARQIDFVSDHQSYALEAALTKAGKEPGRVFIATQPGTLMSDYFLMSKSLFGGDRRPGLVVITALPRSFMSNGMASPGNSDYYRYFAPYSQLGGSERLYNPTLKDQFSALTRRISHRGTHRVGQGLFIFPPYDNQVYKDLDISFEPKDIALDSPCLRQQTDFLRENIRYLSARGIKTLVVSMPMAKSKYTQSLAEFSEKIDCELEQVCRTESARFCNLRCNPSFTRADFLDPIHLSQKGGQTFATQLAQFLVSL